MFIVKLKDTKTVDNKGTLLHFLADLLIKRFPDVINFYQTVIAVEEARKGT
jgi:hypothetical protein